MKKLLPKLWAKITALILLVVLGAMLAVSAFGIAMLATYHAYTDGGISLSRSVQRGQTYDDDMSLVVSYYAAYLDGDSLGLAHYQNIFSAENSNFFFQITDGDGNVLMTSPYTAEDFSYHSFQPDTVTYNQRVVSETKDFADQAEYSAYLDELSGKYELEHTEILRTNADGSLTAAVSYTASDTKDVVVNGYIRSPLVAKDGIYYEQHWVRLLVSFRYGLIAAAAALLAACIFLFVFLLCAAGRKEGVEGIHLNWVDRIPFDLYLVLAALPCALLAYLYEGISGYGDAAFIVFVAAALALAILLGMSVLMTFAARAKAGSWWRNTVVCMVLVLIGKFFRWLGSGIGYAAKNLPLCWKGALGWCGLCLLELIFIAACGGDTERFVAWWFLGHAVLTVLVVLALIAMRKLQKGGEALAAGRPDAAVDLRRLHGEFRKHGENLNNIAAGMQKAVDEQLQAERFRTELITNVSHDIKTPLTSIVNYVDLMKKEDIQPEKAKEYLDVLDRQSARLKKLTEDLVEASKASTGAIPVSLERTDLNVLLPQVAGEYDDRLRAAGLEPVLALSPAVPAVLADGKLLWRVFDNLLSNVCKYAMPGTRVYLSSEWAGGRAAVSFKNISKYPLNISAPELMERFVRGDSSRSTEGSGLGLSIAQSLTQLQQGDFSLSIDGDLFKAVVSFPPAP